MRLATHFDVNMISLILANPFLWSATCAGVITRFLFAAEPSQMIFPLFVRRLVLLVNQIVPAKFAISPLRHCSLASVIFMLVPLDTFGGIGWNPRIARLLLPCDSYPGHCVGFSLGGGGVQWHSID